MIYSTVLKLLEYSVCIYVYMYTYIHQGVSYVEVNAQELNKDPKTRSVVYNRWNNLDVRSKK